MRNIMNKNNIYCLNLLLAFILCACDNSFNPKEDFKKKYIVYAIIKADSTEQRLFLSSTYDVSGYDPKTNSIDPAIKNATVFLYNESTSVIMSKDSTKRNDTLMYKTFFPYYVTKSIKKPIADNQISLKILLQNGEQISAKTTIPSRMTIQSPGIITLNKTSKDSFYTYKYQWNTSNNQNLSSFFIPKLRIVYSYSNNGKTIQSDCEIPYMYCYNDPKYPIATKQNNQLYYQYSILRKINELSTFYSSSNFKILKIYFELMTLDKELSQYYSSVNGFFDDLSIRLDAKAYSNITNGIGILGSYRVDRISVY